MTTSETTDNEGGVTDQRDPATRPGGVEYIEPSFAKVYAGAENGPISDFFPLDFSYVEQLVEPARGVKAKIEVAGDDYVLSDAEKLAFCLIAGVPLDIFTDDSGKLCTLRTMMGCAVTVVDKHVHVVMRDGEIIRFE